MAKSRFVETLVVGIKFKVDKSSLNRVKKLLAGADDALAKSASKVASKGLQTRLGRLRAIGSDIAEEFSRVGVVMGAAAVATVGVSTAIAGFAINQALSQDSLAKMAAALNTSTEELSALEFAADRSGISSSQLTTTLERLNRSATKAAQEGTSASGKAFKDLGISARDAAGNLKSPAELLPEIADGLLGVKDTGRASEIQIELLGRSALRMGALLGTGARGIKDLTDQAADFGAVIDSQAAANSEAFVDSLTNLKSTSGALARQLGDTVIPHLTGAFGATAEWLKTSDNFVRVGLQRAIAGITVVLNGLRTPLGQVTAGFTVLGAAVSVGGPLLKGLPLIGPAITSVGAALGLAAGPATALAAGIAFTVLAVDDLIVTIQGGDSVIRRMADAFGVGAETVDILGASVEITTDLIAIGFIVADDTIRTFIDGLADAVAWAGKLADQAADTFPVLQSVADAINSISLGIKNIPTVKDIFGNLAANLEGVADVTGRARTGELTEQETAAFGADFFGARIATSLESSAQRAETGRGFGFGEGKARRREIEDLGLALRQERGLGIGAGQFGAASRAGLENFVPGGEGALSTAASVAASAATFGLSTNIDLTINAGASLLEMADQAADQVRRQILAQESTIEGMQ